MNSLRTYILVALTLLCTALVVAQDVGKPIFDHPIFPSRLQPLHPVRVPRTEATPETLRVLALMLEFKEDDDGRTSGNGRFDTSYATAKIIDPPPHDSSYFSNHLLFASNYFRKVSDGKLTLRTSILPGVLLMPEKMQAYSPPRTSSDNIEMGRLMQDAWKAADSAHPGFPFSQFDAFVIFHAGVGRDVDLVSLYGYDPRPFDIPSLYLNLGLLKTMFGDSYEGVPVSGGTFYITNSMILPETESRELETVVGTARLQLGINGLLVASIGSHLGLPDLFNTRTGKSGIGRFGLMDGQSIFSWNGLFPPEPSAWEKYFLGWISPIRISRGENFLSLPAVSLNGRSDSVYRLLISEKEYFLMENRNRDANRDGSTITLVRNGVIEQRTWDRDTSNFNALDQDSLYGVVIDVDEFDWSLPGGVSSRTQEFFDGGILIWHIDETVIDATYSMNAVNADPERRGVDLEEADGSQDIGQSYGFISAGAGSEDGTPLDYWYAGNSAPLRTRSNVFSPRSNPNTLSYDLANSHITVDSFSVRGPVMMARASIGGDNIRIIDGFPHSVNRIVGTRAVKGVTRFTGGEDYALIVTGEQTPTRLIPGGVSGTAQEGSQAFAWEASGAPLQGLRDDGRVIDRDTSLPGTDFFPTPAARDLTGDGVPELAIASKTMSASIPSTESYAITMWNTIDGNADSLADPLILRTLPSPVTAGPLALDSSLVVATHDGRMYTYTRGKDSLSSVAVSDSPVVGVSMYERNGRFVAVTSDGTLLLVGNEAQELYTLGGAPSGPAVTGWISAKIGTCIAAATTSGSVVLLAQTPLPGFPYRTGDAIHNSPALADIDGDGQRDIIVFSGNKIVAINAAGAILDHFPIVTPSAKSILTSPVIADMDGDGSADIVAVTQEGLVLAYRRDGRMVDGFPLLSGPNHGSTPAVIYGQSDCLSCVDITLITASDDGFVYGWKTGRIVVGPTLPPPQPWPQFLRDAANSGFEDQQLVGVPRSSELLPASLAYNWPNPVGPEQDFLTHIRFYVSEDSRVTIRIFDLSGLLVKEIATSARGGLDNEVPWDVRDVQSGVYIARIQAEGTRGDASTSVKIAVVR